MKRCYIESSEVIITEIFSLKREMKKNRFKYCDCCSNLHSKLSTESTSRSVLRVKPIFEVNFSFTDQIIATQQIPVENLNCQLGVHWEGGFDIEALAEDGIQLLGNIVVFIVDNVISEQDF